MRACLSVVVPSDGKGGVDQRCYKGKISRSWQQVVFGGQEIKKLRMTLKL